MYTYIVYAIGALEKIKYDKRHFNKPKSRTTDAIKEGKRTGLHHKIVLLLAYAGPYIIFISYIRILTSSLPALNNSYPYHNFTFYQSSLLTDRLCSGVGMKIRFLTYITNNFRFHFDERLAVRGGYSSGTVVGGLLHHLSPAFIVVSIVIVVFFIVLSKYLFVDFFSACSPIAAESTKGNCVILRLRHMLGL